MFALSQIGRGAVLLMSMALVACYIDVYTTGKFPWQDAAAQTPPASQPAEVINDPTVQPTQLVAESAALESPLFLSGTKSFTGQTKVLQGTLSVTPHDPSLSKFDVSNYVPQRLFMSASKSSSPAPAIGIHPVLIIAPEPAVSDTARISQAITNPATAPSFDPPFAGDNSEPGRKLAVGTSPPKISQTAPPGNSTSSYPQMHVNSATADSAYNHSPQDKARVNIPTATLQFMGGSKSLALPPRLPESTTSTAAPEVSPEKMQFMGGTKSPGVSWAPAPVKPTALVPPPIVLPPATSPSATNAKVPNNPQFLGGFKSPGPAVWPASAIPTPPVIPPTRPSYPQTGPLPPIDKLPTPEPSQSDANQPQLFMSGAKSPIREVPKDIFAAPSQAQKPFAPNAMQAAPPRLDITPKVAPVSPAGSY